MSACEGTSSSNPINEQQIKTLDSIEPQIITENEASNGEIAAAEGSGKTLDEADELMQKGSEAVKAGDYAEAAECLSRAVEIRVGHYGELAPECCSAYYKYGCALLYKAQEEADPLGSVPKKDDTAAKCSEKESLSKDEGSVTSSVLVANHTEGQPKNEAKDVSEMDQTDEATADDDEDEGSDEEDESDLDLAWKMLDLARAIAAKNPEDTMEKVDILSALGEVALEREDIENSLSDYLNALSILERLVESDSRRIAELNFRICVVLEISSKPKEAILYCQKAISVCEARVQRLKEEISTSTDSSVSDKESEIETINGLSSDLEKKLEDLQQLVVQPNTFVAEFLKMIAAKAAGNGSSSEAAAPSQLGANNSSAFGSSQLGANSSGGGSGTGFDSPTISTAHTKASGGDGVVQHLGVVGRGVKRVVLSTATSTDSVASKRPALEKGKDSAP
ncbi:hypothetical protein ACHQM5_016952 [Ranunculus cassubicifolius]